MISQCIQPPLETALVAQAVAYSFVRVRYILRGKSCGGGIGSEADRLRYYRVLYAARRCKRWLSGISAAATSRGPRSVASRLYCAAALRESCTSTRMPMRASDSRVLGDSGWMVWPRPMMRRSGRQAWLWLWLVCMGLNVRMSYQYHINIRIVRTYLVSATPRATTPTPPRASRTAPYHSASQQSPRAPHSPPANANSATAAT